MYPAGQRTKIGEGMLCAALQLGQRVGRLRGIPIELVPREPGLGDQDYELLLDSVVQITFQSTPLSLLCLNQPGPRGRQLLSLGLQLGETRIQLSAQPK